MILKDFKNWFTKKENVQKHRKRPYFHAGEVWSVNLGVNVGYEQDGKGDKFLRPMLIIRKFNKEIFWGLPLTRAKKKTEHYVQVRLNNDISTAILSQIRLIDAKRLSYKIGEVSDKDLGFVKEKLKALLP